jgi:hypothetical protein
MRLYEFPLGRYAGFWASTCPDGFVGRGYCVRGNQSEGVVMKSYRKELWFTVPTRRGFVNITRDVEACLRESGVREGLALVND